MNKTINSWGNNFRADINYLNKLPEDKSKILISFCSIEHRILTRHNEVCVVNNTTMLAHI